MHTCMMPVAPNRLVNISSVLEYASVLIGVHQVKYMEVQTMDAVKILMVDDEERMRKLVKDFLTIKGYRVLEAGDGEQAIDIFFKEKDISLVILDVMMPKMDGWETCKTIRRYSQVPIIMLTARSEERDELLGFELGVDEYITKPFSPKILVARIETILRRGSGTSTGEILEADGIRVDKDAHEVSVDGKPVDLSNKEFELLSLLLEHQGMAMTRDAIMDGVWGQEFSRENRTLDVHVRTLRTKLGAAGHYIETVRGVGYKIGGAS